MLLTAVLISGTGAIAYTGYGFYKQQQSDNSDELQRRNAEIVASRSGQTTDDLIDDLGTRSKWNGPVAPILVTKPDAGTAIDP